MNLLIRGKPPPCGAEILLDGQDTSDLTLTTLRQNIAVVHQDPLLFQGSIIENIRYGRLDAKTDEEVRAAAWCSEHR